MLKTIKTMAEFNDKINDMSIKDKAGNPIWNFKGEKNTLLDFYGASCMPCKNVLASLKEIDEDETLDYDIYKICCDDCDPELVSLFQVQSIPALFFISSKDKTKLPDFNAGELPKNQIIDALSKA